MPLEQEVDRVSEFCKGAVAMSSRCSGDMFEKWLLQTKATRPLKSYLDSLTFPVQHGLGFMMYLGTVPRLDCTNEGYEEVRRRFSIPGHIVSQMVGKYAVLPRLLERGQMRCRTSGLSIAAMIDRQMQPGG